MTEVIIRSLKEVARHTLHKVGLRRPKGHLQLAARGERFADIYDKGVWQLGEAEQPLSGHGSSIAVTAAIRRNLPDLLKALGTETLLDIGCGDLTWIQTLGLEHYIGVDIVPSVIEANRNLLPDREFHCLDAVVDDLPEADTVLCREILFHLSFSDIRALIANLARKERRWLIATTDLATLFNSDISTGDFRLLNLRRAPFRFPEPVMSIDDDGLMPGRTLSVWSIESLQFK